LKLVQSTVIITMKRNGNSVLVTKYSASLKQILLRNKKYCYNLKEFEIRILDDAVLAALLMNLKE